MTLSDQNMLACYEHVATLNEAHTVSIVQHITSKKIYVMKTLSVYNRSVYQCLMDHPVSGIPYIVDIAEDDGKLTVIEEYVSGRTLREYLDDRNLLAENCAVETVCKLGQILMQLHHFDPPIIHRDIKPDNIILTSDGNVKLIDLNAAHLYLGSGTEDTALLGTAGYAAPEQYGFGSSGVQADIYALGVLLNEMMLGVPPKQQIPPGKIGKIIRKCTMLDPKDRYGSVEELMQELGKLCPDQTGRDIATSWNRYCIPGFRSGDPGHMAIAIAGYFFIFLFGLTLAVKNAVTPSDLWIERIMFVIYCLASVFFLCNYLDIWQVFGIDKIRNKWLKSAVLLLGCGVLLILVMLILSFV